MPADGEPAKLEIAEGNGQSGRVSVALANPVVGRVTDTQDRPVADVRVAFAFSGDGGGATVAPDTASTDADGRAVFQVTMGTHVGEAGGELRVVNAGQPALVVPVTFSAVSADANELLLVSGDDQSGLAGTVLPEPLVVQVTDVFGNPIPGVPIDWAVDDGSVSDETTSTGADGLTSVTRTLGSAAGTQVTTASAPGLAGSPVTFTHTAGAGAATVLEAVSGSGQSALVGTSLPQPLVVRARDGSGNPVAGLAVTWVVGDGGGTLAPVTSTTDADGLATTVWTLGATPGGNTATAVVSGVGTAGFVATATPGTPPGLSLETQPPALAQHGIPLTPGPVVQLREPDGSARLEAGVAVTVSVVEGGAVLAGTVTRITGSDGRATFGNLSLAGPPGAYTLAFSATGYAGVVSTTIGLVRAATTTTIRSDDPDPSVAGAPVRVRFQVQSTGGTPTGSVRVTADDGASCSASAAAGECTLSPTVVGTRTLTAAYSGDSRFEASAGTEDHRVNPAPPTATTTTITADDPDPSDIGQAVTVRFTVTAASGTPSGTVLVTVSGGDEQCSAPVASGACTLTLAAPGDRTLTAAYTGEGGFAGSSGTAGHTVRPAPAQPVLALATQPSATTISGQPFARQPVVQLQDGQGGILRTAGVVIIAELASGGGTLAGTTTATTGSDGRATFADLSITGATGAHTLRFSASGFTAVVSDPIDVQTPAPLSTTTSITSDDPDPSEPGQQVTVRYSVTAATGTPTGLVTVTASGGNESCSASVAEGACTLTLTEVGDRTLTATYAGGPGFQGSSGTATHAVALPPPLPPSATESSVTVADATLGVGDATDVTVTVRDANGAALSDVTVVLSASGSDNSIAPVAATTNASGQAQFTFSAATAGDRTLTAVAGGVTLAQQPIVAVAQRATTTTITSDDPDPSEPGTPVTVGFTVTGEGGNPPGTDEVTVTSDGAGSCTATIAQGSCALTPPSAGTFTLTATYAGGATFAGSTDSEEHVVEAPAPPEISLRTQPAGSAVPSQPLERQPEVELVAADGDAIQQPGVTVDAELASGSGLLAGTASGTTDGNGRVKFGDLAIDGAPGTYAIRFSSPGLTPVVSDPIVLARAATSTVISSDDPDPSQPGVPVEVSFQVSSSSGTPTGSVTVSTNGPESCTESVAAGRCTITFLTDGDRTITATYTGDESFEGSSGTTTHQVDPPAAPPAAASVAATSTR
ncbi:MAG TPA: Ig-like domain repeat protein [Gemmatimonadales bacterium]|nr:Ig-like domain repeat protein [Gemmatimonadales bacterium]